MVTRLSGLDAYLLYSETPDVPTHTLKIVVVDASSDAGGLTFDQFRHVVQRRLPSLEPLSCRLVDVPLRLHHPMWLEHTDIDFDQHVHRVTVAHPGTRREFDDLVGEIARTPLDRSRPLWEMYFVEGLADHKVAIVAKVHHAVADGVASANLLARAMDATARAPEGTAAGDPPRRTELLVAAGRDQLRELRNLPALIGDTAAGFRKVRGRARERAEHPDLADSFTAPATFMNHRVSPGRRFATATLSLAQVKETAEAMGVSINDLVLAITTGALRALALRHDGSAAGPMIASMPASSDPSTDRISGNAFGNLLVSLPTHVQDVARRVQLISTATTFAKEINTLRGPELMSRWFQYVPPLLAPPAFQWLGRREVRKNKMYNVSISNVPGPRKRGSIADSPITEFYSVGPLTQACGMNVTVWSYVDQLNFSILTDDRTLNDAHEFTALALDAFVELRRSAGLTPKLQDVATAMPQAKQRADNPMEPA